MCEKEREEANKGKRKNALRIKRATWKDGQCYRSASAVLEVLRKGKGRPCTQKRFLYGLYEETETRCQRLFSFYSLGWLP